MNPAPTLTLATSGGNQIVAQIQPQQIQVQVC